MSKNSLSEIDIFLFSLNYKILGSPLITEDKVVIGIADWVIPCAKNYPGSLFIWF